LCSCAVPTGQASYKIAYRRRIDTGERQWHASTPRPVRDDGVDHHHAQLFWPQHWPTNAGTTGPSSRDDRACTECDCCQPKQWPFGMEPLALWPLLRTALYVPEPNCRHILSFLASACVGVFLVVWCFAFAHIRLILVTSLMSSSENLICPSSFTRLKIQKGIPHDSLLQHDLRHPNKRYGRM
jgi:hypothetical protein